MKPLKEEKRLEDLAGLFGFREGSRKSEVVPMFVEGKWLVRGGVIFIP